MKFRWFGCCASCGEELAVKPKMESERPDGLMMSMAGVKCGSCNGPTPISYTKLQIVVRR